MGHGNGGGSAKPSSLRLCLFCVIEIARKVVCLLPWVSIKQCPVITPVVMLLEVLFKKNTDFVSYVTANSEIYLIMNNHKEKYIFVQIDRVLFIILFHILFII